MRGLTLTQKEEGRLQTLNLVMEGRMGVGEAAYVLGISERHTWRILASYRKWAPRRWPTGIGDVGLLMPLPRKLDNV